MHSLERERYLEQRDLLLADAQIAHEVDYLVDLQMADHNL